MGKKRLVESEKLGVPQRIITNANSREVIPCGESSDFEEEVKASATLVNYRLQDVVRESCIILKLKTPSSSGLFLSSISLLVLIIFCLSYCVLVFGVAPCLTLVIRGS